MNRTQRNWRLPGLALTLPVKTKVVTDSQQSYRSFQFLLNASAQRRKKASKRKHRTIVWVLAHSAVEGDSFANQQALLTYRAMATEEAKSQPLLTYRDVCLPSIPAPADIRRTSAQRCVGLCGIVFIAETYDSRK